MRKTLLFLSLLCTISSLWGASPGLAAGCVITVSVPGTGSFSTGSNVTLTAAVSGTCQPIVQMAFYNGSTLLGTSNSSPYTFTWNTTGMATGTYNDIYAVAAFAGVGAPPSNSAPRVIDMVGSPSFGPNPAADPSFGEGGSGSWVQGDNQMCSSSVPYNGATPVFPDGTCEWTGSATVPSSATPALNSTVDSLDDTMHTLSDFVNFSTTFLNNGVGTLSSTFDTWYDQAAEWIDPASNGRLLPLPAKLNTWNTVITNWLKQNYTPGSSPYPWCVPPEATLLNGNRSTDEDTYINNNSNSSTTWGDLPHVLACLNYNSGAQVYNGAAQTGSVYNYQKCLNLLTSGTCPSSVSGTTCDPSLLGRSLNAVAQPAWNGRDTNRCDAAYTDPVTGAPSFAKWVSDGFTLATDEAPKFALRYLFLNDLYTKANTMEKIFSQGSSELQNFLNGPAAQLISVKPCDDGSTCTNGRCSDGTSCVASPTAVLPNAVIYGWVDNTYPNGHPGYAHIVKVTAYSPGRNGSGSLALSKLPWIKTSTSFFTRSYTLMARDGYVYVSVKRWDENHSNSILFPNGRPLWQYMFHNPKAGSAANVTGQGLPSACIGLNSGTIGFGLEPQTVAGLQFLGISPKDQTALANAFMLNDEGDGKVDPYAKNNGGYSSCLKQANDLLANAPESHACAQYIASSPSSNSNSVTSGTSQNNDRDYSLKFVDCNSVPGYPPPDDLTGG